MTYKILIVDDEPNNLNVLRNCLHETGFKVLITQSGEAALKRVNHIKPDLILLDIMMPNMDGFEVCKKLKQDTEVAEIPVIFLTAKTEKDDVITGLKLGAVDYITKPFNQEELLIRVNNHLELKAAKENLQEVIITKDKLFSIIGHDLGNIFNGLQCMTQLLLAEERQLNETQVISEMREDNLQSLMQATNDGYDLLINLLNWSRSQTNRLQANPTKIILKDLIWQNVKFQHSKAKDKKIDIIINIDANIVIFTDKNMLDTIVRNLLLNALKFTEKFGTIKFSAKKIDNFIEISITDTGVGINLENINNLFQNNMISTFGTDGEKGNGLGLVLCKELVEKCDGTISVESKVGKGSTFYINFPA